MKNCDICGRSPARCICPRMEIYKVSCVICSHRAPTRDMQRVEDARGFISHWLCKNAGDCAARVAPEARA